MKQMGIKIVLLLILLLLTAKTVSKIRPVIVKEDKMYLLNNSTNLVNYEISTENTMQSDLAAMSNIIYHMTQDGYFIMILEKDKLKIDITLSKDNDIYRIVYKKDGSLTCIAKPYEKSYVPLTYISKNNRMEEINQ